MRKLLAPSVHASAALTCALVLTPFRATAAEPRAPYTRNVAIVLYEGVELLDFAGPGEVFQAAGGIGAVDGARAFRVYTVATSKEPLTSQNFVKVTPEFSFADAPRPDVVVIPGGASNRLSENGDAMVWIRRTTREAEVTMTVCTGAFVLAKTGVMAGKDVTTHFGALESLRAAVPDARVQAGRRFVDNASFITTAGVSAGIDGALHLVARLLGRNVADRTARYMEYSWSPEATAAGTYSTLNPSTDERGRALQLASLDADEGHAEDAAKILKGLVAKDAHDAAAWYRLGEIAGRQGSFKEAARLSAKPRRSRLFARARSTTSPACWRATGERTRRSRRCGGPRRAGSRRGATRKWTRISSRCAPTAASARHSLSWTRKAEDPVRNSGSGGASVRVGGGPRPRPGSPRHNSRVRAAGRPHSSPNDPDRQKVRSSFWRRTVMRLISRCLLSFVFVLACCWGGAALAQTTGDLDGTVWTRPARRCPASPSSSGLPQLQGSRTTVTDTAGRFRFPVLGPGVYAVTAQLSGFSKVERSNLRVALGATTTVPITMGLSVKEEIVVTSEAPAVDTSKTTIGTSATLESIQRLPLGRNFASIAGTVAGTGTDVSGNVTVYGATGLENAYIVDGVNTTGVKTGTQAKQLNNEFVQEVEVKTGGYEAEFGRVLGGTINVVTKSGGNEFKGDAFGYYDSGSLASSDKNTADRNASNQGEYFSPKRLDFGADLGGYFVKDRLWFFGAYDRVSQDQDYTRTLAVLRDATKTQILTSEHRHVPQQPLLREAHASGSASRTRSRRRSSATRARSTAGTTCRRSP